MGRKISSNMSKVIFQALICAYFKKQNPAIAVKKMAPKYVPETPLRREFLSI